MFHHKVILAALVFGMLSGHSLAAEEGTQPLRRVGYDRPAKIPHQSRSADRGQARHRRHQPTAGGSSRARNPQDGRQRRRRGDRHQRHDRPCRADELRHRRRHLSSSIGTPKRKNSTASTAAAAAPTTSTAKSSKQKGLKEIPSEGSSPGRCPAASPAGRTARSGLARSRSPSFWPRRSTTPKTAFPSARSSPADGTRREQSLPEWPTRHTYYPGRQGAGGRRALPQSEPGASLPRDRRGGPRCLLQGHIARQIVAFSQKHGGYFTHAGLRRPHSPTGSNLSRPTIAATTCGNFRPTARASPRLEILNMLEGLRHRAMGRHSPD